LEARGFKFLRVAARDVFGNLDGVVAVITAHRRTPLHRPSAGPPPRSGEDI
jgi:very-short-patch-repair endonuclease